MDEKTPTSAGRRNCWKLVVVSIGMMVVVVVGAAGGMQFPVLEKAPVMEQVEPSLDGPHRGGRGADAPLIEGRRPDHLDPDEEEEPLILSWEFINGLFVAILVLEFIVFPLLFWVWFGPKHKK